MKVEVNAWSAEKGWDQEPSLPDANLAIYFGGKGLLDSGEHTRKIKEFYPKAHLIGCSTGGEIYGPDALDGSVVVAALRLEKTPLGTASVLVESGKDSYNAGKKIAEMLHKPDLRYVFLLSDGTNVNGSDLIRGMYDVFDPAVIVTGGLAGDAADFGRTLVGLEAAPEEKTIAAVGFYGSAISIGYGSVGGWIPFGPERKITKSEGNVLYELDGKPALDLYKQYVGPDADKLPGSALLFPLSIRPKFGSEHDMVRTIVAVDEQEKTLMFAGDVPEGYTAQLMRGSFNDLVEGAAKAASLAEAGRDNGVDGLAILVSCIGRKLLLGQAISDETQAVADAFRNTLPTVGFYSYGEICHQQFTGKCSLHNETMTITVIHER